MQLTIAEKGYSPSAVTELVDTLMLFGDVDYFAVFELVGSADAPSFVA
jgi:hypothetical protein